MGTETGVFTKKLPGWIFVIAMFFAAVAVVIIAWGAILFLREINNASLAMAESSKGNHRPVQIVGWKTFKDAEDGFQVQYPPIYEIVKDDSWSNAVGIFYDKQNSPQSYSGAIEVWNSADGFKNSSLHQSQNPKFLKKVGEKYITIDYIKATMEEEVFNGIVSTFKVIEVCTGETCK
jgi:hypothetical protein